MQHIEKFRDLSLWMSAQRSGQPTWLNSFPLDEVALEGDGPISPLFVDVGGGIGHQCIGLKQRLPQLKRQIVLQDLQPVIAHAPDIPGISKVPYDFWEEQPIRGAAIYYMKNVLHDYPDDKCVRLLESQKSAMATDSVILVDELVIPEVGCHYQAAELDIALIASLGAKQHRTEKTR